MHKSPKLNKDTAHLHQAAWKLPTSKPAGAMARYMLLAITAILCCASLAQAATKTTKSKDVTKLQIGVKVRWITFEQQSDDVADLRRVWL